MAEFDIDADAERSAWALEDGCYPLDVALDLARRAYDAGRVAGCTSCAEYVEWMASATGWKPKKYALKEAAEACRRVGAAQGTTDKLAARIRKEADDG